jgi:regulator of protease activity HflC (stomatin/prohibitin superfamily)
MIEVIIGLVLGLGLSIFIEMQKQQAHDNVEERKFDESRYKRDEAPYQRIPYKPNVLLVAVSTIVGSFIGLLFASYTIISAGHQGVQVTMGQVNMQTLNEGFHFVNPISNIYNVSVRVTKADLKNANAGTKDLQIVHTDIVVNYRLDGSKVAHVYKEFGLELEDKILMPAMNESFKAVTAHYNSEELVTKRDEVSHAIHDTLQDKVAKYGLIISEISLVNFGFSADYQAAIEQKVIATQQKLKAEQDLSRIQVESEQRIAKAKGEAEAIRIQAQAIQSQGGKDYVQLQAIGKWNGELPKYMMGNATPMINLKD